MIGLKKDKDELCGLGLKKDTNAGCRNGGCKLPIHRKSFPRRARGLARRLLKQTKNKDALPCQTHDNTGKLNQKKQK
ncbi:hypothetical protein SUGI_0421670 [Cryptomeria japonica]|nr:hypothetical protein SUGI_0421670 [Cryptomeria japonica]